MKIDVHNHVIPERAVALLRSDPTYRVTVEGDHVSGGNHVDFTLVPSFYDPADKLKELSSMALDGAVLSVSPTMFYYEIEGRAGDTLTKALNTGLAEFAAADPARLSWMAHVPMGDPAEAARVLEEAVTAGAVGVEVATSVVGRRLDEAIFEPFWSAAERCSVPVMLHPAYNEPHRGLGDWYLQNVIGNPVETTVAIERIICSGLLDRHPGLRIVLVHGGGFFPYQLGRLAHAASVRIEMAGSKPDPWSHLEQIYVDSLTHSPQALAFAVAQMGPDQVLLGSDAPFDMGTVTPLDELDAALDEDVRVKITSDNPTRLFGLL